jgi:hypothetical protein
MFFLTTEATEIAESLFEKLFVLFFSVASAISVVLLFFCCIFSTTEAAETAEYLFEKLFVSFYSVTSAISMVLLFS